MGETGSQFECRILNKEDMAVFEDGLCVIFTTQSNSNEILESQAPFSYATCNHSHTDIGVNHARRQPARRECLGWGGLLRDIELATSRLQLTRSTS